MQRIICGFIVLTTPLLFAADAGDDARKELKALEGKWKTVAMEAAGMQLPKDAVLDFSFVAAANGKATGKTPGGEFQFTMTVDPKKKPKTIDVVHDSGDNKGQRQYGIYKLEGDKFTVCMTPPGGAEGDRAKEFTSKDGGNVVFVFERVKEEKKK